MEITCSNCHQTWRVSSGQFLAARLKFAFGADEHTFVCPNCQAENVISKGQFETTDGQIPVTGNYSQIKREFGHPPSAANDGASAPTNPVTAPEPSRQIHAVVLERGVSLRRDHNPMAEVMGKLRQGEEVNIVDTWINGDEVWVLMGPERWTPVEQDGEALLELLDE
jgi:hypothetical protein